MTPYYKRFLSFIIYIRQQGLLSNYNLGRPVFPVTLKCFVNAFGLPELESIENDPPQSRLARLSFHHRGDLKRGRK